MLRLSDMSSSPTRKRKDLHRADGSEDQHDDESTELRIALLSSLFPDKSQHVLFDYLLAYDGSVEDAANAVMNGSAVASPRKKTASHVGHQSSLSSFVAAIQTGRKSENTALLTKKGRTLHLYSPEDIERHSPCTIIHNFLPKSDATSLLKELVEEVPKYKRAQFQMFERTVESPHTFAFYVDTPEEIVDRRDEYVYNGAQKADVHQSTPEMLRVSGMVAKAVNREIQRRISESPNGQKLKFQSPDDWQPNTSFVNCYDGGKESVGFHSDQLSYLGPQAVIGSLSLGVNREFRVRKIVPTDDPAAADKQGQIAIHLPHNSLLIMHASMQEEWKHSIAPARSIEPHPLAGNKRINVTYRYYRDYLHPRQTPRCRCGVPCVLRCVQKRAATRGRYMWQCYSHSEPGQVTCGFFAFADFDEDGRPPWARLYKGNANLPMPYEDTESEQDPPASTQHIREDAPAHLHRQSTDEDIFCARPEAHRVVETISDG